MGSFTYNTGLYGPNLACNYSYRAPLGPTISRNLPTISPNLGPKSPNIG